MVNMISSVIDYRKLWIWMAKTDIAAKYRGSLLGPFWIVINLAILVSFLSYIYSQIFNLEIKIYVPYVALGFISWYLIAGTIPLEAKDPNKVLNTTLVFSPNGQRVGRYDKIHLFGFQTNTERYQESETIEAGEQPGIVKITINGAEWSLGLSICYDLRFPELYRALGQVDCHIIPAAFTYTTGKDHWEILLRARAIENQCYVLASAQGGIHQNQRRTWGNSMLIDPWGEVLTTLPEGEGFISGVLSKDKLNEVRSKLPALAHRKL
jgi:nitrilase